MAGRRPSFRPAWHGGPMSRRLPGTAQAMNLYPDNLTFTFLRNPHERFVSLWLNLRRVARKRGGDEPGWLRACAGSPSSARSFWPTSAPVGGGRRRRGIRAQCDRVYGPGGVRLGESLCAPD